MDDLLHRGRACRRVVRRRLQLRAADDRVRARGDRLYVDRLLREAGEARVHERADSEVVSRLLAVLVPGAVHHRGQRFGVGALPEVERRSRRHPATRTRGQSRGRMARRWEPRSGHEASQKRSRVSAAWRRRGSALGGRGRSRMVRRRRRDERVLARSTRPQRVGRDPLGRRRRSVRVQAHIFELPTDVAHQRHRRKDQRTRDLALLHDRARDREGDHVGGDSLRRRQGHPRGEAWSATTS